MNPCLAAPMAILFVLVTSGFVQSRPPNFVVVLCDNLGYGDTEPFGATHHRTPYLNRMAREGRRFTHFYVSSGVCTPSRASLLTGCYAQRVGMHSNPRDGWVLRPVSRYGLHPQETTIAEVLKQQGYATTIIGKWHLGDQPEFLPTRQGFDSFYGIPYSDDMTERTWSVDGSKWPPLPLMRNENVIEAPVDRTQLTRRYTKESVDWIRKHRDEPFFLFLSQAMPGSTKTPYSSEAFSGKSRNGPWGDSIEELDWSLGQLLDILDELKISGQTMVIWLSDNGAPLARDSSQLTRGSNQPLDGRGYSTSEGGFRVPMIAWQPGTIPAGTICDSLATTMDLLPTMAELTGAELPPSKIDGKDISALLFGDATSPTPHEAFYYYQREQLQAVRSGRWKLFLPLSDPLRHPYFKTGSDSPLLFDVVDDPGCKDDVSMDFPEVVKQLTKLADRARREFGDQGTVGQGQRPIGEIQGEPAAQLMRD